MPRSLKPYVQEDMLIPCMTTLCSIKKKDNLVVYVAVYVDDIVFTGTDAIEIADLKVYLHNRFKIKDLGQLHYFWV